MPGDRLLQDTYRILGKLCVPGIDFHLIWKMVNLIVGGILSRPIQSKQRRAAFG